MRICRGCATPGELGIDFSPNGKGRYNYYCKPCASLKVKTRWDNLSSEERYARKRKGLLKKYGLTNAAFERMLFNQDYACKICMNEFEYQHEVQIDHDHANNKVRGLLCTNCNQALGKFYDRVDLLTNAINYLTESTKMTTANGGFLADLGLDTVDDDPNAVPDGKYPGFVFDAKVVNLTDAAKGKRLVLTYKIAQEGPHNGKTVDEWKSINAFDDARTKGFLKQRMKSLGVPEERLATLTPEDLIGTAVNFTVKKNGQYTNVNYVEVRDSNSSSAASPAASAGVDVANLL